MSVIWFIITTLVGGLIIGWLGKVLAPGDKDNIAFVPMWIVGIIGMLAGSFLYYAIFGTANNFPQGDAFNTTKGIDWWRHVWQVVVTAILVAASTTVMPGARKR